MKFKEYFLANEHKLRGILDLKDNPIVPTAIPITGFQPSGARKMNMMAAVKPYQPIFRKGVSSVKKS